MKLKRSTYRHIESEIYGYGDTVKAIADMRDEIINGGKQDELGTTVTGGMTSSPTERLATRLADSKLLREMEAITDAIRHVYEESREDTRRVIWARYRLAIGWTPPEHIKGHMVGLPSPVLASLLMMDESSFYRHRAGFIYAVAERLGWY